TMHLIAYNLVRALMLQAAERDHADPLRLSLAGTLAAVRQWAPALAAEQSAQARRRLLEQFWRCVARDAIPWRPNRLEPRARKRRPKNYQLLTRPRSQFKEIQHRNRYRRPLS
ncbi:MAG: IS4/IS5 family transposase, partial [Verrucomicrobia bacterium]|nr:IS4/IS5 family transposase [Verrucomicrobiota bacterium]